MKTVLCCASLLLLLIGTTAGLEIETQCDPADEYMAEVLSTSVSSCPNPEDVERCELKRKQNATIIVDFKLKEAVEAAKTQIYGKLGPVSVPFPFEKTDACEHSGLSCPMEADKEYKYTLTLPVLNRYPKLKVGVQIYLKRVPDEANVFCVGFPAEIIDP